MPQKHLVEKNVRLGFSYSGLRDLVLHSALSKGEALTSSRREAPYFRPPETFHTTHISMAIGELVGARRGARLPKGLSRTIEWLLPAFLELISATCPLCVQISGGRMGRNPGQGDGGS